MTDRELLERAAKAEGHAYPWVLPAGFGERPWNPLTDDGDALRLAVALRLDVLHNEPQDHDAWVMAGGHMDHTEMVDGEGSRAAATRRAITRAAAALAGDAGGVR